MFYETLRNLEEKWGEFWQTQEWKVHYYLESASQESILDGLLGLLKHNGRGIQHLKDIFNTYASHGSSGQQFWTEESLRRYLENTHPTLIKPVGAIPLLWRCLRFYAFLPFSSGCTERKVDFEAFERAVLLLAARGTDLLGTVDNGDILWRDQDRDYIRNARFERLLRSIAVPVTLEDRGSNLTNTSNSVVADTIDVLAASHPFSVCPGIGPVEEQIDPVARRLQGQASIMADSGTKREDLTAMVSLLLRLRVKQARWGRDLHFGHFDAREAGHDTIAGILVRGLIDDEDQTEFNAWDLARVIDLLPNLDTRFFQLWAVLFQPPRQSSQLEESQIPTDIPRYILEAISLFAPFSRKPADSCVHQHGGQHKRIALEKTAQSLSQLSDLNVVDVARELSQNEFPTAIIITGHDTANQPAVFGAILPGSLWMEDSERHEYCLFQLEPEFRIFRWTSPKTALTDIVNTEDMTVSLASISNESSTKITEPFWVCFPRKRSPHIKVDPQRRRASLEAPFTDQSGVNVSIHEVGIFNVAGGVSRALDIDRPYSAPSSLGHGHETGLRIEGDALKMRIQGFGSTLKT